MHLSSTPGGGGNFNDPFSSIYSENRTTLAPDECNVRRAVRVCVSGISGFPLRNYKFIRFTNSRHTNSRAHHPSFPRIAFRWMCPRVASFENASIAIPARKDATREREREQRGGAGNPYRISSAHTEECQRSARVCGDAS